jgi:hypothetical protein
VVSFPISEASLMPRQLQIGVPLTMISPVVSPTGVVKVANCAASLSQSSVSVDDLYNGRKKPAH